jgi:hypothetical protein
MHSLRIFTASHGNMKMYMNTNIKILSCNATIFINKYLLAKNLAKYAETNGKELIIS